MNILLLGNKYVGKTSYLNNIVNNKFISEYETTSESNIYTVLINTNIEDFNVAVHDIPSHTKELNKYVNDTHAIFLMYDMTNKKSFLELKKWYDMINKFKVPIFVIGNKYDIKDDDLEKFSKAIIKMKNGTDKHWFVSTKLKYNLYEPFLGLIKTLKNNNDITLKIQTEEDKMIELFEKTDSLIEEIENLNILDLSQEKLNNIISVLKECRDTFVASI
jgi:small GTP-binding protein